MRSVGGLLVVASALAACESGGVEGTTVTISLRSGTADLVAFRNEGDETWQLARQVSSFAYKVRVDGMYRVTVACHGRTTQVPGDMVYRSVAQLARTIDDGLEVDEEFCPNLDKPPQYAVTGTMTQPGALVMTTLVDEVTPNWTFQQSVGAGTYSLYAVAGGRVVARRGIAVNANLALPNIDVDAEGTALTGVPFTIANARPGVLFTQAASVGIEDAKLLDPISGLPVDQPLEVYAGDPAGAQVIPTAALGGNDVQIVTLSEHTTEATSHGMHSTARAVRRAYKVGDAAAFTLPEPIADLAWTIGSGPISIAWSSLPADMAFRFEVNGQSTSGAPRGYAVDVSPSFLVAAGEHRIAFDTSSLSLPGGTSIDLSKGYTLDSIGTIAGAGIASDPEITAEDHVIVDEDVGQALDVR